MRAVSGYRWLGCLFSLMVLLILAGCNTATYEEPTLEDMGLVTVMGFDYVKGKKMKVLTSIPQPSQEAKEKTQFYEAEVTSPIEAFIKIATKSEKTVVPNQMRVVLFSEDFSKKTGMTDTILSLYRDPRVGDNVVIAVVKGKVSELMQGQYKDKPEFGTYINNLLRPRRETAFHPFITIHDYVYRTTGNTSDPLLPYLEKKGDDIEITKVAIIKEGKLVGFLTTEEGRVIQAATNRGNVAPMKYHVQDQPNSDEKVNVTMEFVRNEVEKQYINQGGKPRFEIRINLTSNILEYQGKRDLEKTEDLSYLEQQLSMEIQKLLKTTLMKTAKLGVDPINMLEKMRADTYGDWQGLKIKGKLKDIPVDIRTTVQIVGVGTLK